MRRSLVLGASGLVVALGAAALAQDRAPAAKPKKPTRVSVVESVPLTVAVSALPAVTVANTSLDVRVVNADEIPTADAAGKFVTLPELDGVTINATTTSSEIDTDGYRAVCVFVSRTVYPGSQLRFIVEYECGGIWASTQPLNEAALYSGGTSANLVFSEDVLGPKIRIRIAAASLPFPTVSDLKVKVYLRR